MNKPSALRGVRSLADFQAMFALDLTSLPGSIAVFPAGISSFGAEMQQAGHAQVVSLDPYYDLSPMDMLKHVTFVIQGLAAQVDPVKSAADINQWQATSQEFLADYSVGQKEGRYVPVQWSQLEHISQSFDIMLCPDLFNSSAAEHAADVIAACGALAKEVRVFPIQDDNGALFPALAPVMLGLQNSTLGVEIKEVRLSATGKPSAMLRVWSKGCVVT